MKEKFSPKYQHRNRLLKWCMDNGLSNSEILQLVEPMRGKTDEKKEQMAERILRELCADTDDEAREIKKGIRPGTEKRCELMDFCSETGIQSSELLPIIEPMDGKTEEEKERIAERVLRELKSEYGDSPTN